MCKRLPGHDHEEMGDLIKNKVAEGYRQATICVQALVAFCLSGCFRKPLPVV